MDKIGISSLWVTRWVVRSVATYRAPSGTAAFCLASKYPTSRSVSLNPGAAPTNPVLEGPGPERSTVYHVVGDLISSHMSSEAASKRVAITKAPSGVVRVKKRDSKFGNLSPHDSTNILKSSGEWKLSSAEEEDELYQKWSDSFTTKYVVKPLAKVASYFTWLKYNKVTELSPIPDSNRWSESTLATSESADSAI